MVTNTPGAHFYCITLQFSNKTMTQSFLDHLSLVEGGKYAVGFCVFQKALRGCPKEGEGKNYQVVFKLRSKEPRGSLEVLRGKALGDQEKGHARTMPREVLLPTLSVSLIFIS